MTTRKNHITCVENRCRMQDKIQIGDLVFAFAYRGPTNSALIGIVCVRYPKKKNSGGWDMLSVFTPNGYELVPEESCRVIARKS